VTVAIHTLCIYYVSSYLARCKPAVIARALISTPCQSNSRSTSVMHSRHAFCRRENWRAFAREEFSRKRARLAIVSDLQWERRSFRAGKWPFYKNKAFEAARRAESREMRSESREEIREQRSDLARNLSARIDSTRASASSLKRIPALKRLRSSGQNVISIRSWNGDVKWRGDERENLALRLQDVLEFFLGYLSHAHARVRLR